MALLIHAFVKTLFAVIFSLAMLLIILELSFVNIAV
jgi:hypothetical protein